MAARLVVQKGPYPDENYPLTEDSISLGRAPANYIVLNDPEVSRRHANITFQDGLYQIEDSGSTNGTFVNGLRVHGSAILQNGDVVQLGESISLIFYDEEASYSYDWDEDEATELETSPDLVLGQREAASPETADSYVPPEPEPDRRRQILIGCSCTLVLCCVLTIGLVFFLDAFDNGRLLYCGPLYPVFESILGPFGFSPACLQDVSWLW